MANYLWQWRKFIYELFGVPDMAGNYGTGWPIFKGEFRPLILA